MAKDFDTLKQAALQIKNETAEGANTADRVGGLLEDIIENNFASIGEYNVSKFHPTSGIDGTNKYTLETAIALVPEEYRSIGIKCSFVNVNGDGETWEFLSGVWETTNFKPVGKIGFEFAQSKLDYYNGGLYIDTNLNTIEIKDGVFIKDDGTRTSGITAKCSAELKNSIPKFIIYDFEKSSLHVIDNQSGIIIPHKNYAIVCFYYKENDNFRLKLNCSYAIIDGKPHIGNTLQSIYKYRNAQYLGNIYIDTTTNTIKSNGGIVVFFDGTRTNYLPETTEQFTTVNGTGIVVYDCVNQTFKLFSANDLEIRNYSQYIIIASYIALEERYEAVGNVYKLFLDGKQLLPIESFSNNDNKLTLYDDVRDLSNNFNVFGFSVSGKKIIANSTENYACYNKRFISDQRKAQYIVSIPNQNGIVRIGALQSASVDGTISYSTCCEVDFMTKKLKIYRGGGSNGTSVLNLISETDITQDLAGQTEFIIEVSRNRKITSLRLINYYKQYIDEIIFDGNGLPFANGAGNHRPYYFVYTNIQNTEVTRLSIFGAYDVALAHVGNSLSESNGRADAGGEMGTNWIEQVMEEIGWDGSIVAQSGMSAEDAIIALENEIKYMKPKILSVMIGTNGGVTDEQILQMKKFADDNNIPYVQHHVPMTEGREPSAVNSAQYIAEQLDRLEIIGARMDIATALNGNVNNGYNPDYFNPDKLHTNQNGNNAMKKQFFIDLPQFNFNNRN